MQILNLPPYDFKTRVENGKKYIFDPFRSKYLVLTPEENVRQHFARYLIDKLSYPATLMMSEHSLSLNKMNKRCDLIVFDRSGEPLLLVECKAPEVKINQAVFDQVARYNQVFKVSYLMVSNGLKHYCCKVDFATGKIEFLKAMPSYEELT
jgi:hypothetical protein